MITNIISSGDPLVAPSPFIFAQPPAPTQECAPLPAVTDIIEALENFQDFEPEVRAAAITLRASELGISHLHFYAIALQAGLGGGR